MPQEQKKGLPQELLKLIACVTMLIDHVAAALYSRYLWPYSQYLWMRTIGRIAFPIYCFLLAEGVHYTRHPWRYALRLTIGMLLSEYFFDMALFGGWTWEYQSVMVTLLLGYLMLRLMKRIPPLYGKLLVVLPFALAAELCKTDYGALGIAIIALFGITRDLPHALAIQAFGLCLLPLLSDGIQYNIEPLCVMALLPIGLYQGGKLGRSKVVQWAFYLFYPVHLAVLTLILRLPPKI